MDIGSISGFGFSMKISPQEFKAFIKDNDIKSFEKKLSELGAVRGSKYLSAEEKQFKAELKNAGVDSSAITNINTFSRRVLAPILGYAAILADKGALSEEMKDAILEYSLPETCPRMFLDFILFQIGDRITQQDIFQKNLAHPIWDFLRSNLYSDTFKKLLVSAVGSSKDNFILFSSYIAGGYVPDNLDWHYARCFLDAAIKLNLVTLAEAFRAICSSLF